MDPAICNEMKQLLQEEAKKEGSLGGSLTTIGEIEMYRDDHDPIIKLVIKENRRTVVAIGTLVHKSDYLREGVVSTTADDLKAPYDYPVLLLPTISEIEAAWSAENA